MCVNCTLPRTKFWLFSIKSSQIISLSKVAFRLNNSGNVWDSISELLGLHLLAACYYILLFPYLKSFPYYILYILIAMKVPLNSISLIPAQV